MDSINVLENAYSALTAAIDSATPNQVRVDTLKYLIRNIDSIVLARAADSLQLGQFELDRHWTHYGKT
jgi:hypothetical protein